jgi:tetrapyrrole methylase family protein/MazG family protein/ATP diphosphatase
VNDQTPLPTVNLVPLPGKQTGATLPNLVGLMQRLLAPDGCPWDREQTLTTLLPYLVEETYEVVDALQSGHVADHCEELGDLLLQVIFQAELRHAEGAFGIDEVIDGIVRKLIRRHPHVFGEVQAKNATEALASWAKLKASEKAKKGKKGALDGIPRSAPALVRAMRAGEKAGAVGFDWPDAAGVRDKVDEELAEFDEACASNDREAMKDELGDLLFAVVNLARKLGLDAEHSLREATDRFGRRFAFMEEKLGSEGRTVKSASPEEQNQLWEAAKSAEKAG